MNHEYVLFSKNTCQNSMVNVLDKDKILWYVMRAYKNENTAEDRLSNETYGLEYFIPKQKVLRTVKGKKVFFQGNIYRNRTNYHSKFQTEGCRRVVGVSFPSACELLCRRPPLFQRGGMGIYAVFPERHAALCGESEKR